MLHREDPLRLYAVLGALVGLIAAGQLVTVAANDLATGLLPRFPTLILASALMVCALACPGNQADAPPLSG